MPFTMGTAFLIFKCYAVADTTSDRLLHCTGGKQIAFVVFVTDCIRLKK